MASLTASSVTSWNSIRRTGTFGLSTSVRCQLIDSPSRSGSVASSTSEASFSAAFSVATLLLLVGRNDVVRLEVAVDVHGHAAPGLVLDLRRDLPGGPGQIADVADARHHVVAVPEETRQRPRLRRRLDNHKRFCHKDFRPRPATWSRARPVATLSLSPDAHEPAPGCASHQTGQFELGQPHAAKRSAQARCGRRVVDVARLVGVERRQEGSSSSDPAGCR